MSFKKVLNLKNILEEIDKQIDNAIVITLPSNIRWEDYEKEIDKVKNYSNVLNFKVHNFPKGITVGGKCYVVYDGRVMGWMEIVGFSEKSFECNTTGKQWNGKFIERSGPFHYIDKHIKMKGFQGFRYFNINDHAKIE